ncbi:MAG TPA: hypothetical protein VKC34_05080, partial [Blastocatellia bacterium]|nr:hypothetical protein [Blastocatellia bacterium]
TDKCSLKRTEYFIEGTEPQESCEAHTGEMPESPLPLEFPEDDASLPDKTRKLMRETENAVEDARKDLRKRLNKAMGGKP